MPSLQFCVFLFFVIYQSFNTFVIDIVEGCSPKSNHHDGKIGNKTSNYGKYIGSIVSSTTYNLASGTIVVVVVRSACNVDVLSVGLDIIKKFLKLCSQLIRIAKQYIKVKKRQLEIRQMELDRTKKPCENKETQTDNYDEIIYTDSRNERTISFNRMRQTETDLTHSLIS